MTTDTTKEFKIGSQQFADEELIRSVKLENDDETLDTVYENDVNSLGLWLHKKGFMKGQRKLNCNWVSLGLLSTTMQLYFAIQLVIKYYFKIA